MSTLDSPTRWGKYPYMTYRQIAERNPGYLQWAATKITGPRGQLCALALAIALVGEPRSIDTHG